MAIIEPLELEEKLLEVRKRNVRRKGVSTGFDSLDEHLLLSKQYLMVVTGIPSCGKSEVVDALAVNTAILHGWSWLYFSPENAPTEEHLKKIVEKRVGQNLFDMSSKTISDTTRWANEHFAWVDPHSDRFSLDAILEEAVQRIETGHNVDALVIDPWNEIDASDQAGMRDDQYISKCMTKLRRFHRKYNVLSCVVIHPTKLQKDATGNYPVPNLYDCNGGAMWRNKADFGLCVHRHDMSEAAANVYIQKIKFKSMGKPGMVKLDYDLPSGRFKDQTAPDFLLPSDWKI
ncbi:MAG TPA: DnaB-like helicase C-terminal domain-containing protein [Clostridia bacterium]|nr:DnaB-like helicase C-terminal domain-containing protein [Clostridia bacterium]